jgi:FkbM family methyltransferase
MGKVKVIIKKNKVIFSGFKDKKKLKFNYIDIGARGDIVSPWKELEGATSIIGFEPDAIEAKRLNDTFKNRKYFGIALWSNKTTRKVCINEWESTSSMYEPNSGNISNFEPQHWTGRKPKSALDVECDTLDAILAGNEIIPDFIKIDTQGAELEILRGAEELLKKYNPLVTCETWCYEVYKGAPMMHEVIAYMDGLGYQIFDMEIAAAWRHKNKANQTINSKQKAIGYEILFVKTLENIVVDDIDVFFKFLLLLELYGYRDYAIFLLEQHLALMKNGDDVLNMFYLHSNNESKLITRIKNKLLRKIANQNLYPNIKY